MQHKVEGQQRVTRIDTLYRRERIIALALQSASLWDFWHYFGRNMIFRIPMALVECFMKSQLLTETGIGRILASVS